jgi:tetratricopeptide (TPR) repeat protein
MDTFAALARALGVSVADLVNGMSDSAQGSALAGESHGAPNLERTRSAAGNEFARELGRLMGERGVSYRALARRIHTDTGYVARLASGRIKLSQEVAELCDKALSAEGRLAALVPVAKEGPLSAEHLRRAFLARGLAAMTLPAVSLDGLRHIAAALENASSLADDDVVTYCGQQLGDCMANDGRYGPVMTLPTILGLIAAIEKIATEAKPRVRRELLRVGAKAAEFTGWLYRDAAKPELANYWRDRAVEWAQVSGDAAMQGYVLLKKSQAAWDERDALRMLTLAEAVQEGPWKLPARVRAEAAQQEARGHAMLSGHIGLVERKLAEARALLAQDESPPAHRGAELAAHYDNALFGLQVAICYCEAKRPVQAIKLYDKWLSADTFSRRDFGYFLALKGGAYASAGRPDEASYAGIEALNLAQETGSARTLQEITRLALRLRPWNDRGSVRELCTSVLV